MTELRISWDESGRARRWRVGWLLFYCGGNVPLSRCRTELSKLCANLLLLSDVLSSVKYVTLPSRLPTTSQGNPEHPRSLLFMIKLTPPTLSSLIPSRQPVI